jgi:hypothetical protein
MLRFLCADNRFTPQDSGTVSGEVWQLVNLHPIRPSFGSKPSGVELSAHFTSGDASDSQKLAFGICAYALQGAPKDSEALWKNRRDVYLSYTDVDEVCHNEHGIWQKMSTQLLVPPDADFLMVQVRMCPRPMPKTLESAFEFPGQYVSNVPLRLLSDPPPTQ